MGLVDYLQPIGMLLVFFIILFAAYYASRSIGKIQTGKGKEGNLTIVEVMSVGPQKTIQIVRTGNKYMVIGVTKDHITFIRELTAEDLSLSEEEGSKVFSKVLDKMVQKGNKELTQTKDKLNEPIKK